MVHFPENGPFFRTIMLLINAIKWSEDAMVHASARPEHMLARALPARPERMLARACAGPTRAPAGPSAAGPTRAQPSRNFAGQARTLLAQLAPCMHSDPCAWGSEARLACRWPAASHLSPRVTVVCSFMCVCLILG